MSDFFSGKGDDGYTGILGEGRVPKYHPRPTTYGSLDEASAVLGLARAFSESTAIQKLVIAIQRDLFALMAEVAAAPEAAERFQTLDPERLAWLEEQITEYGQRVNMPEGFILGGDSRAGALFDLGRTVVRRAERLLARLQHAGESSRPHLLGYLNRLSTLCFILALYENELAGIDKPSMAKPDHP